MANAPPNPANASRRVNDMVAPGKRYFSAATALTNHISRRRDRSKTTEGPIPFAAVQQPQWQLNRSATLMVYIDENAIANRIRSRAFGLNGRAA